MPPSMLAGPTTTRSSGMLDADRRERLAVAAQAPAGDAVRVHRDRRGRRLDADDQDVAVAEADEVLGGRPGAADVVDLDRAVLRQGGRVDQDDRHAGAPDLLDLRVVVGQADGDDAVHGRPAHRAGQAAVQRRDEVQARSRTPRPRPATPSLNAPKNGFEKMTDSACGVSTPIVSVWRWVSIRATGWGV